MIHVNPQILIWARETAGLTLQEAATKISVAEKSLKKIEKGEKAPSHSMLLRMADKYRRPLLTFYLEDIPVESDYGADFRGLSEQIKPKDKALIAALLRYAKASQGMIRDVLESEEECTSLPFAGWLRRKWDLPKEPEIMGAQLQNMTQGQHERLVQDALDGLNMVLGDRCTRNRYYEQADSPSAFRLLRSSCEESGIFVVLKGNTGGGHNKLSSNLFRAFVIADDIAPFMVINKEDSRSAMSFSVLHEIVHLLLDQTGISDSDLQSINPIEKFCNRVAGQWLLPEALIREEQIDRRGDLSEFKEVISRVAKKRNLSHTMVATRLHQERVITRAVFRQLDQFYAKEWERFQNRKKETQRDKEAGDPSFYRVRRSELGNGLLQFVNRMIQLKNLTVSKAAIILAAKPGQVSKLLRS